MKPPSMPCGSCPYRQDVPTGVWHADEYAKLPGYEGDTGEQSPGVFMCHQQDGSVCSGWAHVADEDTLAVRLAGISNPDVALAIVEYRSPIPMHESHSAAAEHGLSGYVEGAPPPDAERIHQKLERRLTPQRPKDT